MRIKLNRDTAFKSILDGYKEGISEGGGPFVLEENNGWLRKLATGKLRDPEKFWVGIDQLKTTNKVDSAAVELLKAALPDSGGSIRICRRRTGAGSLGRPRFVGVLVWQGAKMARKVKR